MSLVSPGEGRLRGFIRALTALREAIKASMDQDSHLSLYDAIQHSKCVDPDIYDQLEAIPNNIRDGLLTALRKVSGNSSVKVEDLKNILDDCYEVVNRSLDAMNGRAPVLIPDVPPVKRLKLEPFEAPNIAVPQDRSVFIRDTHPFELVIKSLSFKESLHVDVWGRTDIDPSSVESTPCTFVDSLELLQQMVKELEQEPVISVDLENHNYYSYHGFTCLLQVSSKCADYLVDAIKLKTELKVALPMILSNPNILKILHGAEHDSGWLQRDFDCHLVSVFDSFIAAKKLDLVKKSLNGLLQHYFDINLDKQYQLADWRVRPLPAEMCKYARLDTHYLIPLWERLKKALIEKTGVEGLIKVYEQSSLQCLKLYRPEHEDLASKWKTVVSKSSVILDDSQQEIVRRVFLWRDETARRHDVCHHAVLANHWLVRLAMSKPVSKADLKRSLRDGYTRFVDTHAEELVTAIKEANLGSIASKQSPFSPTTAIITTRESKAPESKLIQRPISISSKTVPNSSFAQIMNGPDKSIKDNIIVVPQSPIIPAEIFEQPPPAELTPVPNEESTKDVEDSKAKEIEAKVESIIQAGSMTIESKPAKKRKTLHVEAVDFASAKAELYQKEENDHVEKQKSRREKDTAEEKKQKYKKKRSSKGHFVTFSK